MGGEYKNDLFARIEFKAADLFRGKPYDKGKVVDRDRGHDMPGFLFQKHGSDMAGQLVKDTAIRLLLKINGNIFLPYNGKGCILVRGA